jgi:hypothetical protein
MSKFLSAVMLFLMSSPLFAALKEMDPNAPSETVSVVWVIVFGVIFIGAIVGFFVYLWLTDKSRNPKE